LIAGRVVQAAGAAAAIVMSRAITRDSFDGAALTRALATITIVFALVPGLTPLLGGVLEELSGWRSTFAAVAVVGAGALVAVFRSLDETLKSPARRLEFGTALTQYRDILRDRVFLGYTLAAGAVMGSLAAFFAGSPALLIETMGLSPLEYGIYPAISVLGFMIGGLATRKLANRVAPRRLARAGLVLLGLGAVLLFAFALFSALSRFGVAGAMVVHISGLGLFLPTAIAAALQRYPTRAGAAASLQGFLQMSGAALGVVLVSVLQGHVPMLAFSATMIVFTALAALALATLPQSTER
jgi:DHA1 family bicyclomycin/chloramphenicol resistance-like MFS transporter